MQSEQQINRNIKHIDLAAAACKVTWEDLQNVDVRLKQEERLHTHDAEECELPRSHLATLNRWLKESISMLAIESMIKTVLGGRPFGSSRNALGASITGAIFFVTIRQMNC